MLDNDTISYTYDELGRVMNRTINGAANVPSEQYDSVGRVQTATNPLGTFNYTYVSTTDRLDHVDFPNGPKDAKHFLRQFWRSAAQADKEP